jgi:hypothetical protein
MNRQGDSALNANNSLPGELERSLKQAAAGDGRGDPNRQLCSTLKQKLVSDFSEWKTEAFEGVVQEQVRYANANYAPS